MKQVHEKMEMEIAEVKANSAEIRERKLRLPRKVSSIAKFVVISFAFKEKLLVCKIL